MLLLKCILKHALGNHHILILLKTVKPGVVWRIQRVSVAGKDKFCLPKGVVLTPLFMVEYFFFQLGKKLS